MAVDLRGKPILITGASSGIGRATALACARAGMPVALAARRLDRLEALAGEIASAGGRSAAFELDVADAVGCEACVSRAEAALGPLHAVFANAGRGLRAPFVAMDDRALREIFEVNFFGTVNTLRPAVEGFVRRGSGHALICSSSIGKLPLPGYGAYCATKAAQWHLGLAMRHELAPLGVAVSTVHPIGTRTEFFDRSGEGAGGDGGGIAAATPAVFMQPPERVARAVVGCLRRPRAEVWTSLSSRLTLGLLSAFPGLGEVALRAASRRLGGRPTGAGGGSPAGGA